MTISVSDKSQPPSPEADYISVDQLRSWVEFACWTTLAISPFLYWVNGPAVSTDQLVLRTAIIALAGCGAAGLRCFAGFRRRKR